LPREVPASKIGLSRRLVVTKRTLLFSVVTAAALFVSRPICAHHGVAHYDMKKTIALTGTITAFNWGNPHCLVHMDVRNDDGRTQHWTLEMSSTSAMSRRGWSKDTLKQGDEVVAETHPAQNGIPLGISSGPDFSLKLVISRREINSR
jgi:hypothetical protein